MNYPKERVVIDITYIPSDLSKKTKFKYILNCLDYFSKYLVPFLIKNKNGNILCEKQKNILKNMEHLHIVFVHGKPYNPHSQGIFERINQTVRNGLICAYLEMEKILIKMIH